MIPIMKLKLYTNLFIGVLAITQLMWLRNALHVYTGGARKGIARSIESNHFYYHIKKGKLDDRSS